MDPLRWTEEQAIEFYEHIRAGQANLLSAEAVFQFRTVTEGEAEGGLCLAPHPGSQVHYGPEGRLFVRRLMLASQADHYARAEVLDHLPRLPAPGSARPVFANEEYDKLQERLGHHQVFTRLFTWTRDYEAYGPVQVC